ncbi:pseudoazurin [Aliamphritea hakodatensis]|uniref:pseudoazurin n=1 Tax=Aliamphritea hakodatensis TaxID=2895352 RepID=UPI0022FD3B48|nr:pseudoazurin [Aliamphritea hakodatensis]
MKLKNLLGAALMCLTTGAWAAEIIVEMKNAGADGAMVFEPAVVKAEVGDTVTFVPTDMAHNSELVPGLAPSGAASWKGGIGQAVSVTLDKEGVYVYQCLPHVIMAMVGVIVAGEPDNLDQVIADSAALKGRFVMNKDRLDTYLEQAK